MNKLIITVDDYGLTPGVNSATLKAVANGTISSVHVLANFVEESDIVTLKEHIDRSGYDCGIGIHFSTTSGPSLLQKESSITTFNRLKGRYEFLPMTEFNYAKVNHDDVKEELEAQYKWFTSVLPPNKIDAISSHDNIHLFSDKYLAKLLDLTKETDIPFRSPVQWRTGKQKPRPPKYKHGENPLPIVKNGLKLAAQVPIPTKYFLIDKVLGKDPLDRRDTIISAGKNVPNNVAEHFFGQPTLHAIEWTKGYVETLRNKNGSPYISELFAHLADKNDWTDGELLYPMHKRMTEYAVMVLPETKAFCDSLRNNTDVQLCSYRNAFKN